MTEAKIPDNRALAPEEILIRLCPIMAQPPMPEKSPERILAVPCATASLLPLPRVPVISSTMLSVSKDSINPTPATMPAYGSIIISVSSEKGTSGRWKGGKPPLMEAISPTVLVSIPSSFTRAKIDKIAAREAGISLVSLGNPQMISMVNATRPSMI